MSNFTPKCLPLLIGSLPIDDHTAATKLILDHTPDIPLWAQLPVYKEEGMIPQFLPGLPCVTTKDEKTFIDTLNPDFETELLGLYEDYIMVTDGGADLDSSRFVLTEDTAKGFFEFLLQTETQKESLTALKGQITGPITFCTGTVDEAGRAIFYNEQLRDAAIKLLALKAKWQVQKMKQVCGKTIMFFDEPALAAFGSSAFITITPEDIKASFEEVFEAVRTEDGLTGVHVCANTEWSLLFEAGVDIVSFDAYSYFDKFILYPELLKEFLNRGGILATGIIPTAPEHIDSEDAASLTKKWFEQTAVLEGLGIPRQMIFDQSLITPSCGTGSVTQEQAVKVLELTRDVSAQIRASF